MDVIVHVLGPGKWYQLERELAEHGFHASSEDAVVCRKRLRDGRGSDVIVDFMPDDKTILGFSNRWYSDALKHAADHRLPEGANIRVVTSAYFLGTKLEAWRGRGNNDPLSSRDVEDILNVVDGRSTLIDEVEQAAFELREDIAKGISDLLRHRDFAYAVQSTVNNSREREQLLFQRLEALTTVDR